MADIKVSPDIPDFTLFRTVFYYCFLILIVPITAFFGTKFMVFDGIFQLGATTSNVYAAIVTIVALHVFLGLYIYKAYTETPGPARPAKPSKQD